MAEENTNYLGVTTTVHSETEGRLKIDVFNKKKKSRLKKIIKHA